MILMEKLYVKNILSFSGYMYDFIKFSCKNFNFICTTIVRFFAEDFPTNRIDFNILFENFMYAPGGSSARNVNHWVQIYSTKQFSQFDFGQEKKLS